MQTRGLALRALALGAVLAFSAGCRGETDRSVYVAGSDGVSTLTNTLPVPIYLSGCAPFHTERRVEGRWIDWGPPFVCVWEGLALPVPPSESMTSPFTAADASGYYRLRYEVGLGCDAGQPLSPDTCDHKASVYTRHFSVEREPCDPAEFGCQFVPGAPNFLCSDGIHVGGPDGECTRDPASGQCGYEFLVCP